MRGSSPPTVTLSQKERSELEQLVKRHGTAQQIALRARIVLVAGDGGSNAAIAREHTVNIHAVRL